MEHSPGKIWLFRLVGVGVSVLLALVMVEGFLWAPDLVRGEPLTGPMFEGSVYEFSSSRHHRLIPNGRYRHSSYEFSYLWANNSLGMRDREHPLHKAPGTFRILILGDSFIQGHGVSLEDTLVRRLEASLNQPKRTQIVEVLNGGVFGYSPFLEYLYVREIIDSVAPDAVIVGFFLGNDVGEDYFYTHKVHASSDGESFSFDDQEWPWSLILEALDGGPPGQSGNTAVALQGAERLQAVKDVLRRSRTLTLVKNRFVDGWTYPERRGREFALVREHRSDIRYNLGLVNYPVLSREERLAYWDTSKRYLAAISTLCREHGARMILLVIPPVERLNGETDFQEPYDVLVDLGRRLSVPVINLLPDFLGQPSQTLYYEFDRHWTTKGHKRTAEVLDRELRQLQVLPAEG